MDPENWQGRIDSEKNFENFRWHQWVKPLDLTDESRDPNNGLGFAFLGFKSDEGIRRNKGRVGASKGPQSIRSQLSNLPCFFTEDVALLDAGDIVCEDGDLEKSQQELSRAVEHILSLELFPIILGGGHETALGHYLGIQKYLKAQNRSEQIGIFNIDAHFDLRPYDQGGNSGSMFRQIADDHQRKGSPFSYFCAGIQKYGNTIALFKTAKKLGVQYILARDLIDQCDQDIESDITPFLQKNDVIYLTVCADVFSSAFAPGVSAVQPLGLDPEIAIKIIKLLIASNKVISFDISEVSPRFDHDHITASLAKVLIFSVVNAHCLNYGQLKEIEEDSSY